jgi:ribose 5-phosphate isomerase B
MPKKLVVASDHAGVELKRALATVAEEQGFEVQDLGTNSTDSVDYPDYAHRVASEVAAGGALGLLVCGTGIGMAMAANRHPGIRAAVCDDVWSAEMTRRHNDANVLCIGARMIDPGLAADVLKTFLSTGFDGGRHERRVRKIELP